MPPDAVTDTLNHLWNALHRRNSPAVIAGGLAMSYWGSPRSTQDIDLLLYSASLPLCIDSLRSCGAFQRGQSVSLGWLDLYPFQLDATEHFVTVDIDVLVGSNAYVEQSINRSIEARLTGVLQPVRIISLEDLILNKLYSGRLLDAADVSQLLESHLDRLDIGYIENWATEHQTLATFRRLLSDR